MSDYTFCSRDDVEQNILRVLREKIECNRQIRAAEEALKRRNELDQEMRRLLAEYGRLL